MNDEYLNAIALRAAEVQPQIQKLVENFQKDGLSQEEIILEVSFALIHEGYRMRDLEVQQKEYDVYLDCKSEEGKEE